jgi:transcription elongation factor GreA
MSARRRSVDQLDTSDAVVRVGSRVRVKDVDGEDEFILVPPEEADIVVDQVSAESPLGRALLGRRVGDRVRFRAPGGVVGVTVVDVSAGPSRLSHPGGVGRKGAGS